MASEVEQDWIMRERAAAIANNHPPCARCGERALGFAIIRDERYCHGTERSCYTAQSHEEAFTTQTRTLLSFLFEQNPPTEGAT